MKSEILSQAIAWNTKAPYTENGQRIAAIPFSGGSYMVDVDRGLDYFYPNTPCNRNAVMSAYLNNRHGRPDSQEDRAILWEIRDLLESFAMEHAPTL